MAAATKAIIDNAGIQRRRFSVINEMRRATTITVKSRIRNTRGRWSGFQGNLGREGRKPFEGAAVVTVNVAFVEVLAFNVTILGETVHEDSDGAPVHPIVTVWLNPPDGVIAIE
jgi:hypothetical protein